MAVPSKDVVLGQIGGLEFGFYTDEEIRKLSVTHVVNPITFDAMRNPLPGGLYDPAMGPIERFQNCSTCKLDETQCPGHFGHIELPFPCYNPFLFNIMYKLLRCMCFKCYRFKMEAGEVEKFATRLALIKQGRMAEALAVSPGSGKKGAKKKKGAPVGSPKGSPKYDADSGDVADTPMTGITLQAYQETVSQFMGKMTTESTCKNCTAVNPKLRKEGYIKIFMQPLTQKQIATNQKQGTVILSPLSGHPLAQGRNLEYLTPSEVLGGFEKMWSKENGVLGIIFAGLSKRENPVEGFKGFFVQTVAVVPNKYRPAQYAGGMMTEHPQNGVLCRILNCILDIKDLGARKDEVDGGDEVKAAQIEKTIRSWNVMQNGVNELIDSSTARAPTNPGVRQFLEKKEGLFRKNMMGKRVNFAARSTISPDPMLLVGEIGVPPYFAKKLSFPETVTPWNATELRQLVERGCEEYPGAVAVEDDNKGMISLAGLPRIRREALAKTLYQGWESDITHGKNGGDVKTCFHRGRPVGKAKVVYRHLRDGDLMLTNRQPTLHKPSLMAHKARVLHGERTIRFHYANCATFNADFDGDEINLHLPQDHYCRAEGYDIVHADHQYIVPTDGKPIRGLIQDSVDSGVLLTKRDTFLKKSEYMQVVYAAIAQSSKGEELCIDKMDHSHFSMGATEDDIIMECPAILKPAPLWTGKQVVSTVMANLGRGLPPVTTSAKCKTPVEYWGEPMDGEVCFRQGYFVHGVMDKGQYGMYGLVHACQELYGDSFAGLLLSALGKLFVFYLQNRGFTCGLGDCFLYGNTETNRAELIKHAEWTALKSSAKVIGMTVEDPENVGGGLEESGKAAAIQKVTQALGTRYRENKDTGEVHDANVKGPMHQLSSQVVKLCLPNGIVKPFRHNCLTTMTVTGAKGSFVNFSQISCLLGQQELEGRRVPRMNTGKTLPCFAAYDPGARSGGFIGDRFLSGLRPPEYYFHCMAGREGLVDTSVKTANSGYLQRCLIKNMESIRIQYDCTVRDDSDGTIVQFYYGEDGLDVTGVSYLKNFKFMAENGPSFKRKLVLDEALRCSKQAGVDKMEAKCRKLVEKRRGYLKNGKNGKLNANLPLMATYKPTFMGVTSEKFNDDMWRYIDGNPDGLLKTGSKKHLSPDDLLNVLELKYMESLAAPGEAVGVIAAQSIGEPSTQMTLNTFHMAGRGEANVTLGIPRLREILMTASKEIRTPVMTLPLKQGQSLDAAEVLANKLRKIKLAECLKGLRVEEYPVAEIPNRPGGRGRLYKVILEFHPMSAYPQDLCLKWEEIKKAFESLFVPRLRSAAKRELTRMSSASEIAEVTVSKKEVVGEIAGAPGAGVKKAKDRYEDDEDNDEFVDGKAQYHGGRSEQAYDAPDDEDKVYAREAEAEAKRKLGVLEGVEEKDNEDEMEDSKSDVKPEVKAKDEVKIEQQDETQEEGEKKRVVQDFSGSLGMATDVKEDQQSCVACFELPLNAPKLLMLGIAEKVATIVNVREFKGIDRCYVVEGQKGEGHSVQTDGINFNAGWANDDVIDVHNIRANDVYSMLNTYGVEAARSAIVNECRGVFGAYGIGVDARHLGLIADHMTNLGGYRACNRLGIGCQVSPILKMTFETSCSFLRQAALGGEADPLLSPAARIAVGRMPLSGTGSMEIVHKFKY